jgi:MOSC domain-containing protein YiiM
LLQRVIEMIEVVAVNVGTPQVLSDQPERVYSSIAKRSLPLGMPLWLSAGNLAGDAQADLSVHGGPDKAVYAYPSEHLAAWTVELDGPLGPAAFGENLSTLGVLEVDVRIGDIWKWDDAFLRVSQPRWPCFKLALHRRRRDVQQRMRTSGRTGWYLRVLQPGEVVTGSPIEVSYVDPAGLTVADAHLAMSDRNLDSLARTEALANHDALANEWRTPLRARLDASAAPT